MNHDSGEIPNVPKAKASLDINSQLFSVSGFCLSISFWRSYTQQSKYITISNYTYITLAMVRTAIASLAFGLWIGKLATASPQKRGWYPTVNAIEELGNISESGLNRDSCGSVRVGDRVLWTCRDTQPYDANGIPTFPVWSSSAAWTNFDSGGTPQTGMYSPREETPFYPYASDECSGSTVGDCGDGTRYALWPDQPPIITSTVGSTVTGYTWVRKTHISGLSPVSGEEDPGTTLYKFVYDTSDGDRNAIPSPSIVNENWWWPNTIPYGAYGSVVKDGTAYLFGQPSNKNVCLAKVPVGGIEDYSQYQYYYNGAWQSDIPQLSDSANCNIPNVSAGGQGTYYFSYHWNKWVWIGQGLFSVSSYFMVATADNIEGPWEAPVFFYQGHDGTYGLSAYTLQAHPGLSASGFADSNAIFISYTKSDTDAQIYSTPLVRITWN